jgi:hypothetical protein
MPKTGGQNRREWDISSLTSYSGLRRSCALAEVLQISDASERLGIPTISHECGVSWTGAGGGGGTVTAVEAVWFQKQARNRSKMVATQQTRTSPLVCAVRVMSRLPDQEATGALASFGSGSAKSRFS